MIGGRDQQQNELVVKKYLNDGRSLLIKLECLPLGDVPGCPIYQVTSMFMRTFMVLQVSSSRILLVRSSIAE